VHALPRRSLRDNGKPFIRSLPLSVGAQSAPPGQAQAITRSEETATAAATAAAATIAAAAAAAAAAATATAAAATAAAATAAAATTAAAAE